METSPGRLKEWSGKCGAKVLYRQGRPVRIEAARGRLRGSLLPRLRDMITSTFYHETSGNWLPQVELKLLSALDGRARSRGSHVSSEAFA